ncbi:DUF1847 domain-containing protein [Chloroflexota bacterium]
MNFKKNTLSCSCTKQGCWRGNDEGIPEYCQANNYLAELETATQEYNKPEALALYKAAAIVGQHNNGMTPRLEEALLFAKEMKFKRIGFAACTAMDWELSYLKKLFVREGFQVFTASCQIGRVNAESRGVPEVQGFVRSMCNPIAQAKILNSEDTQLNFVLGLCMGHDILFNQYSKAPVSTLIVKDRVTGNNPAAALYGWHRRKDLFGIVISDDKVV